METENKTAEYVGISGIVTNGTDAKLAANRPFARSLLFTFTTRILFVFPFMFEFGNPSKILNNKSSNLQ